MEKTCRINFENMELTGNLLTQCSWTPWYLTPYFSTIITCDSADLSRTQFLNGVKSMLSALLLSRHPKGRNEKQLIFSLRCRII